METETPVIETETPTELPPLVDGDLNFSDGYQARIGEHAEGSTFKNLGEVFKSSNEAQRTTREALQSVTDIKKEMEELRGATPTPVEMPADAVAYKALLKMPEMPEGITIGDDVLNKGIEYAMSKGHGPEALADFLAFDLERASMEADTAKNAKFNQIGEAKSVINAAVGEQEYDVTIANAKFVSETLGLPLEAEDLVGNPNMVLSLSKLKDSLSEGTLKGASLGGVQITSGSKLAMAEDIVANPANPLNAAFFDNSHVQHEQAITEHARLISESAQ